MLYLTFSTAMHCSDPTYAGINCTTQCTAVDTPTNCVKCDAVTGAITCCDYTFGGNEFCPKNGQGGSTTSLDDCTTYLIVVVVLAVLLLLLLLLLFILCVLLIRRRNEDRVREKYPLPEDKKKRQSQPVHVRHTPELSPHARPVELAVGEPKAASQAPQGGRADRSRDRHSFDSKPTTIPIVPESS